MDNIKNANLIPPSPNIDINTLKPFTRFCCSIGAIPTSYLIAMSYEEQLLWLCDYLQNTVIPTVNNNGEAVAELQGLYVQLKNYVDNYFKNLDVQEEINNKLDEMALNGLFDQYFSPILQQVNDIENNYRNKFVPITMGDLSQEVKEALTGGSTAVVGIDSVNTENIVDNAVNYKKVTNNIMVKQDLKYSPAYYNAQNFILNNILNFEYGSILGQTGANHYSDKKTVRTRKYITPSGDCLFVPINNNITFGVITTSLIEKPSNIYNFNPDNFSVGSINGKTGEITANAISYVTKNFLVFPSISHLKVDPNLFEFAVFYYNNTGKYLNNSGWVNDLTIDPSQSTNKYKIVIRELHGESNIMTEDFKLQFFNDVTSIWLSDEATTTGWLSSNYLLKFDGSKVYRILIRSNDTDFNTNDFDIINYLLVANNVKTQDNENVLIGKNFSILGDSFSAYNGIIPENNIPYYYGNNAGVSSVNDMWWQRLVDNYGASRLVIEASSGSSISNIGASSSNVPMSDLSRCQNLALNGINPDFIIILGGTNDFSHSNPNIGNYNGLQTFPTTNDNFRNAYALMLQRIRQKYPYADIFCCGLPLFVRTPENKYVPQQNSEPQTVVNYSNAIKEIAHLMNCQYIDLNQCGFTPTNYYPTYCIDSETRPTHPNALGQKIIGDVIASNIINFYKSKNQT